MECQIKSMHYHGLIVVTDNEKDFLPMPGIKTENWVQRNQ